MRWAYKLVDKVPVECDMMDPSVWDIKNRRVDETDVAGVHVSTVFLVIDHSWGYGPPLLFETMVFGGELDMEQDRYCTWDEAVAGHAAMVKRVKDAPLKAVEAGEQQATTVCQNAADTKESGL